MEELAKLEVERGNPEYVADDKEHWRVVNGGKTAESPAVRCVLF